jgi:hypothetical protein
VKDGPVDIHGWKPTDFKGHFRVRSWLIRFRRIFQFGGGAIDQ